jgi:hypothetical protein
MAYRHWPTIATNAILIGPNGVGKSTLARNIAHQALIHGHTVLFISAGQLLGDLAALDSDSALRRRLRQVIALMAFLTVVDLFATQAILPSLTRTYGVSPAAMGSAVNASTLGMAIAGVVVAAFSRQIDRRLGIVVVRSISILNRNALAFLKLASIRLMLRKLCNP